MEANEKKGDDMMNGAFQDWRSAGKKLKAGDVDGYMKDYKNYLGKLKDANGYFSAAESGKAAMADQAMTQAQQTFNASTEALSAISNPAGYVIGKGVSYGTTKIIDYAAPNMNPTLKKVLVTGASLVGTSYGSGLVSGVNPNIMKPLVETGIKTEIATTAAQTYVTYHTEGARAAAEDLILGAATMTAGNYRGKNGKTLGETISGTGQAHGAAAKDAVNAAGPAINNAVKSLTGSSEGGQAIKQASDANYHNPKGAAGETPANTGAGPKKDPHGGDEVRGSTEPKSPPPLDPKAKDAAKKPPAEHSEATKKALIESGNDPGAVKKLQQASDATGVAVAIPGTDPKNARTQVRNQQEVMSGNASQKTMHTHTKSIEATGDIPFHPAKGKMGDTFRKNGAEYRAAKEAHAKNPTPESKAALDGARTRVQSSRDQIKANFQNNLADVKSGRYKAIPDANSKCKVIYERQPNSRVYKKVKPDIDPATTNANKGNPNAKVNDYKGLGKCSEAEAKFHQAAAEAQGQNALTNHASDVNSPDGPKKMADSMVFIEPKKQPVVKHGADDIVGHMDSLGMDVHQNWRKQAAADRAQKQTRNASAASRTAGQTARNAIMGPSTDRATSEQHQLRQTRLESRNQYTREARDVAKHYPGTQGKTAAQRVNQRANRDYSNNVNRYTSNQRQFTSFDRSATAADRVSGPSEARAMSDYRASRTSMRSSINRTGSRQARVNRSVGSTFSARRSPGGMSARDLVGMLHVTLRLPLFMPPAIGDGALADDGPTPWRDEAEMRLTLAAAAGLADQMEALAVQATDPADTEPLEQSEVHVQVHEMSAPAWKADFERRPAFHEGVVEYFSRQVMADLENSGEAKDQSYPAFENEVLVAYRLATLAGEDALRQAYFMGNMRLMYYRLGQRLGVTGVGQAETTGRRFLDQASLLMNRGRHEEVQAGFGRYLPPQKASASPLSRPAVPYRSGS